MLDQNTDRMWYVIGAVIIGAAIIFIINGTMPQLFASVGDTFSKKTDETTAVVDGIRPMNRRLTPENLETRLSTLVGYDEETNTWTLDLDARPETSLFSTGFRTKENVVMIPYGKTYTVSYEVKSPVAVDAVPDINANPVTGDHWSKVDHDDLSTRRFNGEEAIKGVDYEERYAPFKAIAVPANTWTTIEFSYTNTSPDNVHKVDVYDFSDLGVKNDTNDVLRINMRNITTRISE